MTLRDEKPAHTPGGALPGPEVESLDRNGGDAPAVTTTAAGSAPSAGERQPGETLAQEAPSGRPGTADLARLTVPMRDLLWTVAQHKYGWTHASRHGGELQVADALARRGLVEYGRHGRKHHHPIIVATDAGRSEIERRWPVSPFALGTYDHQPGGWTPREGVV